MDVESVGVQTDSCRLPVPLGEDALDQQLIQLDQAFAKAAMKTLNVIVPQDILEFGCRAMGAAEEEWKVQCIAKACKGSWNLTNRFFRFMLPYIQSRCQWGCLSTWQTSFLVSICNRYIRCVYYLDFSQLYYYYNIDM